MICPSCGHDNPDDANFCGQCGSRLPTEHPCPTCGRGNPPGLRFCRGCGGALEPSADSDGDGTPPKRLGDGRYVVERFLGEGGRKRVYLAHDTVLDRDVAVGLVKTTGLDPDSRVRVTREAQSMARLGDHPHVVTVHDIGEENGDPYIVSQFMAGGSLDEMLESSPGRRLDLETTLKIADGV